MNDEFLHRYRRPPRREFAETLYARISSPSPVRRQPTISVSISPLRQMARGLNILATAAIVVFALSPRVRTSVLEQVVRVG
jgi:hypothetical protein